MDAVRGNKALRREELIAGICEELERLSGMEKFDLLSKYGELYWRLVWLAAGEAVVRNRKARMWRK
jgi:hypothetical protein